MKNGAPETPVAAVAAAAERASARTATGMIAHLGDLDSYVTREIIEPFDHTYLNKDVEAFRERVPTTENFCMEIFERLKQFPGARLVRIRLEETGRNSFEYAGQKNGDEHD